MTHEPGKMMKIDEETGEEIPTTPEEQEAQKKLMRDALTGQGMTIEFSPEVLEQLKAKGMTEDDLLSMLADTVNAKQ